jgi:hypothetical protein
MTTSTLATKFSSAKLAEICRQPAVLQWSEASPQTPAAPCRRAAVTLRRGDLAMDGERPRVIDFADCGFGWFLYDPAAAARGPF